MRLEFKISRTSAYRIQISTGSADENALLLLADGQLVAILVELADGVHGAERGKWTVEATFGLLHRRIPRNFPSAVAAAIWISDHVCHLPFFLSGDLVELG